jgi:hypothetical protein
MTDKKPTPAQLGLMLALRDKRLIVGLTEKTCDVCERNGWVFWSKNNCFLTEKGKQALEAYAKATKP